MNILSARAPWSTHSLAVTSCCVQFDSDLRAVGSARRVPGGRGE